MTRIWQASEHESLALIFEELLPACAQFSRKQVPQQTFASSSVSLTGKVPAPSSDEMRNLLLDLYPQMKLSFGKAKVAFALGKSSYSLF